MIAKFAKPVTFDAAVAAIAGVDPNFFILNSSDYFVTVSNSAAEDFPETEVFAGDDPVEMVGRASKFVLSDLGTGDDNTYRLFDDDGNHMASICIHTLHALARDWGIDLDAAMRELVALRF